MAAGAALNLLRRRRLKEEAQSFFQIRAGLGNGVSLAGYVDFRTQRDVPGAFTLDNHRQSLGHVGRPGVIDPITVPLPVREPPVRRSRPRRGREIDALAKFEHVHLQLNPSTTPSPPVAGQFDAHAFEES